MEKLILGGLTATTTALMVALQQPAWAVLFPMLLTYSLGRRQSLEKMYQTQLQVSPAIMQQWEQYQAKVDNLEQGLMELQKGLEALHKPSTDWEAAINHPTPRGMRVEVLVLRTTSSEVNIDIVYTDLGQVKDQLRR